MAENCARLHPGSLGVDQEALTQSGVASASDFAVLGPGTYVHYYAHLERGINAILGAAQRSAIDAHANPGNTRSIRCPFGL